MKLKFEVIVFAIIFCLITNKYSSLYIVNSNYQQNLRILLWLSMNSFQAVHMHNVAMLYIFVYNVFHVIQAKGRCNNLAHSKDTLFEWPDTTRCS